MRKLIAPLLVTALLGFYIWGVGLRAIALLKSGEAAGIAIGIFVLVLPLLAIWFLYNEWRFASKVQKLANSLAISGQLVEDTLPKSAGGRIDKTVANEQFQALKAKLEVEETAANWFNIGFAYDAAGDRRRARAALKKAISLELD